MRCCGGELFVSDQVKVELAQHICAVSGIDVDVGRGSGSNLELNDVELRCFKAKGRLRTHNDCSRASSLQSSLST